MKISSDKEVKLNRKQKEAILCTSQKVCILAGPGTGKTKTLVAKVENLIRDEKVSPSNILVLTFTKKAAKEIHERIEQQLGKQGLRGLFTGTFHSFGMSILDSEKKNAEYKIIEETERLKLLRDISKEPRFKGMLVQNNLKELSLLISNYKNKVEKEKSGLLQKFVKEYDSRLKERGFFDFDDLISMAYDLFRNPQSTAEKFRQKYKYILIDEFQDTNEIQYELIKQILTPETHLFVIGDPLQSIYAFRGAKGQIFETLREDFPDTRVFSLVINYRSTKEILDASSQLFPGVVSLEAARKDQGKVEIIRTLNEYTEASWVINKLSEIMGGLDLNDSSTYSNKLSSKHMEDDYYMDKAATFSDFAIIYRTHGMSKILEKKFRESAIAYQKVGEESIYLRPEVENLVSLFRFIYDPASTELPKKLMETGLYLQSFWGKDRDFSKLLQESVKVLNTEKQLEGKTDRFIDFNSFINDLMRFNAMSDPLKRFVEFVEELESTDYYDKESEKVTLTTMHAAKGLEFKYVFICGFNDGLIPFIKNGDKEMDLEEERRLLYVAMTRAKTGLYLLTTKEQMGKRNIKISRFSSDLEKSSSVIYLQDEQTQKVKKKRAKQKAKKSQMQMF